MLFCWEANGVDGFPRLMIRRRLVISDHSVSREASSFPARNCCSVKDSYFGGSQILWSVERSKKQVFSVHLFHHIAHKQNFQRKCKPTFKKHDIYLKLEHCLFDIVYIWVSFCRAGILAVSCHFFFLKVEPSCD